MAKAFAFAVIVLFSNGLPAHADDGPVTCADHSLLAKADDLWIASCVSICESVSRMNSQPMQGYFQRRCTEAAKDNAERGSLAGSTVQTARVVDKFVRRCLPLAAKKSVKDLWEFAKAMPYLAKFGWTRLLQAKNPALQQCDADPACKRAIARNLNQYDNKTPGGDWTVSDEQIDREIAGRSVSDILQTLEKEKPPAPPADNPIDHLSTVQKVAVGVICLGEDFTINECGELAAPFIPIPGVGTVKSAVRGAKAVVTVARESAPLEREAAGVAALTEARAVSAETAAARQTLIARLNTKVYTTEAQNRAFIARAEAAGTKTQFLDVENSVMKKLNDGTGDKNLVTSLTNLHKEILLDHLNALKSKYPGVTLDPYSDFKSVKVAISDLDKLSPEGQKALRRDLEAALNDTNAKFGEQARALGVKVAGAGDPATWFKAGMGESVDQASLAARRARQTDGALLDYGSNEVQGAMTERLQQVEEQRQELARTKTMEPLMDSTGVPRADVFDLTRKYDSADALAGAVRDRYSLSAFTTADAEKLQAYARGVDEFSPTILIPKRETIDFAGANQGGTSADFLGMGSANLRATAGGLAKSKDLSGALTAVRQGEADVTKTFRARMDRFKQIVGDNVKCSGDDCVQVAKKTMSDAEKVRLVSSIARDGATRQVRLAFVGEGVPEAARMQLSSHGEAIEKSLRKNLEGKIPYATLQNLTFGLDMKTATLNEGQVNLIIGRATLTHLSGAERATIQDAFAKALEKYNEGGHAYESGSMQMRAMRLRLIPVPPTNPEPTASPTTQRVPDW